METQSEKQKIYHAFWSDKAAEMYGYCVYSDGNKNVKCVAICSSRQEGEDTLKWDDKIYLGEVKSWVSSHLKNLNFIFDSERWPTKLT